ncbi:unnamed protein product [Amaranthus hypochondriacus]
MAKLQKIEGQVELNCSADIMFEMNTVKLPSIASICPHKVAAIQPHLPVSACAANSWRWDCIFDGKTEYIIEKIEEVDEENKMIHHKVIGGEIMKHYNILENKIKIIPNGDLKCILIYSLEYEKMNECAPPPCQLLHYALNLFQDLASHLPNPPCVNF